jgi:hypothetical protein
MNVSFLEAQLKSLWQGMILGCLDYSGERQSRER